MDTARDEFAIGEQPVIGSAAVAESQPAENFDDLGELPRSYDTPLLIAVARDPRTIFAYWDIDWPSIFGDTTPRERAVFLRVIANNESDESLVAVEPLAGSCYVTVGNADTGYRLELGYYDDSGAWQSIIASDRVIMPRDSVEQGDEFQLVTVPLHLSFQRLVDIFRGSKFDGQAISGAIANLQQRFEPGGSSEPIRSEHAQLIEALEWSLSDSEADQRSEFRATAKQKPIGRARLERILGFGAASPTSSSGGGGS
ncbi:MAG: DUF4912 domain-containing protein [Chthoniobacterales bacterium]